MSSEHTAAKPSSPQASWTLDVWLDYLLNIHHRSIDMGLERTKTVYDQLNIDLSGSVVITVAGTNGKGTTCRLIENMLIACGKSVAVYSSPHIQQYNERLRLNDQVLSNQQHCQAFLHIDQVRADTPLTYFEFSTLGALYLIAKEAPDFVILEVGLGGRLDAVNVVDADVAVITSIGLDHQDYLGDTRELIAIEKAGIFRANKPAIIGEPDPPTSLLQQAASSSVEACWQGIDFSYQQQQDSWSWSNQANTFSQLPLPFIPIQNASTALQVLSKLAISFDQAQLEQVLRATTLPGRFEVIRRRPTVILDVAHNPQATEYLRSQLQTQEYQNLHFVVAMLSDKDIQASVAPLETLQANWYVASLEMPRGAPAEKIKSLLHQQKKVVEFAHPGLAYDAALAQASKDDLIVVFGSFFTVSHVKDWIEAEH